MRILLATVAGFAVLAFPRDSYATTVRWEGFTCPVGGERFEASVYGSRFVYGTRPDGRPLETSRGFVPLPECPGNHLILYRDFSQDELPALTALIQTPEYQRQVATETQFYRVAWLELALNPNSQDYVWYLLMATWYTDKDLERKRRYQSRFLEVAEALPVRADDLRSLTLRLRVLNVYRETGQFERTLKGLQDLPVDVLAVDLPQTEEAFRNMDGKDTARWNFVADARRLKKLALRQDASASPIDILPEWMAIEECFFREPKSAFEVLFCSSPEMLLRLTEDKATLEESRSYYDYDGPIQAPPPPPEAEK